MLALLFALVAFFPVPPNSQHVLGSALDGDHVRKGDAVLVFKSRQVIVNVNLKELETVIISKRVALLFGLLFLNVGEDMYRIAKVDVTVEASHLQLLDLVRRLPHHMGDALGVIDIRRPIRHNNIFSRQEDSNLPPHCRVVVDLLKSRASQAKRVQHPLMLGTILNHLVGQLVVHVILDTLRSLFLHLIHGTHDLSLNRTSSRESLRDHFRLETHSSFRQQGGVDTTRTRPRLGALLILHAKDFQAFDKRIHPIFAAVNVSVNKINKV